MTVTLTRRERQRAATVEEIKEVARGLMREQGTTDVRFTDIAKEMGMTPPALYRYYADRDALLTDLITDAYRELGREVAEAREAARPRRHRGSLDRGRDGLPRLGAARAAAVRADPRDAGARLRRPARTARPPTPPRTRCPSSRRCSSGPPSSACSSEPLVREVSDEMAACAADKHPELGDLVPPESFQAMIQAWATLHGITCLDAYGQFDWMTDEARDALFVSTLKTAALAAGIPID